MKTILSAAITTLALALPAEAKIVPCGGSFSQFTQNIKLEASARGHSDATIERFFANVRQDQRTLKADNAQGHFLRPFTDFSGRLISKNRMTRGKQMLKKHANVFSQMEREFGINPGVLLAFWAFETDYGAVQGDFDTLNSLMTLGHDCRRPELFQPQIFAALELYERGSFDPREAKGAWAGEIGMVQMLPADILEAGVDGNGDGHIDLRHTPADALLTGANMLRQLGWNPNEPWLQEVTLPSNFDWSLTGIDNEMSVEDWSREGVSPRSGDFTMPDGVGAIIVPQGRRGPAFIAYPNFHVYFEWNQSFTYVTTAAYFANLLEGAPRYKKGNPDRGLSGKQMISLQKKLVDRGYDVGEIDGILGEKSRRAVQQEQLNLGMPADAWPTVELLNRL